MFLEYDNKVAFAISGWRDKLFKLVGYGSPSYLPMGLYVTFSEVYRMSQWVEYNYQINGVSFITRELIFYTQ